MHSITQEYSGRQAGGQEENEWQQRDRSYSRPGLDYLRVVIQLKSIIYTTMSRDFPVQWQNRPTCLPAQSFYVIQSGNLASERARGGTLLEIEII